jgi:hypothetical protein
MGKLQGQLQGQRTTCTHSIETPSIIKHISRGVKRRIAKYNAVPGESKPFA